MISVMHRHKPPVNLAEKDRHAMYQRSLRDSSKLSLSVVAELLDQLSRGNL